MVSLVRTAGLAVVMALSLSTARAEPAPAQTDLGYGAIESGNWASAEKQLRTELSTTPDDPMRLVNLAYVLQQQGRGAEAAELYRKVLAMNSNPKVAVGPDERNVKAVRVKSLANKGIASIEQSKE